MEKDIAEDIKRIAKNANTAEFNIFMRCLERVSKKSKTGLMQEILKISADTR